jgi:hypothetical protein
MLSILFGLRLLGLAAVLGIVAAPSLALVDPVAQPAPAVEVLPDGRLGLHLDRPVPLAALVREIGAAIGAAVTVRRDPGEVGPIAIEALPADDLLVRLAGRHSLVLRYEDDRVAEIILLAWRPGGAAGAPGDDVEPHQDAALPTATAPPLPWPPTPSPEMVERSRQAAEIRDIVKLSYQDDDASRAELAKLLTTSDDPAIRGSAASALIGSARASRALVDRALTDDDGQVRLRAAQGLLAAKGDAAAARLRLMASSDPAPEVRAGIAELLAARSAGRGQATNGPHPARVDR